MKPLGFIIIVVIAAIGIPAFMLWCARGMADGARKGERMADLIRRHPEAIPVAKRYLVYTALAVFVAFSGVVTQICGSMIEHESVVSRVGSIMMLGGTLAAYLIESAKARALRRLDPDLDQDQDQ